MSIAEKLQTIAENEQRVYDAGHSDGYEKGKSEGSNYDEFWDVYQENGNRGSYECAFYGQGWNDITFKPKYNIYPTSMNQTFRLSKITDLVALLESQNVTMDTSRCDNFSYAFGVYPSVTHIGVIDTRAATSLPYTFSNATALHTIDELIFKGDGSQNFNNTFGGCTSLKNIKITGCIGQNFDIKSSYLITKESIVSVINALSTEVTGYTLSLKKTAVQNAFGTDYDSSTEWTTLKNSKSNWTITLS